jgi:SAM-dependent methyltransferase
MPASSKAQPGAASADTIQRAVRDSYAKIAEGRGSCCGPSCCGSTVEDTARTLSESIGYSAEELDVAPSDANLGLGCGNPTALAELKPGEVVVDLGAGAGLDAFIAAHQVGPSGRVIGVDMTPQMLERARENAVKAGLTRIVEFREGTIESLPVVSASADVVLSNCVINLSPDKAQVFREAFRVLKPGGRLAVSDIVLTSALPADLLGSVAAYVGCISGALLAADYLGAIEAAGFTRVRWTRTPAAALLTGALSDPQLSPTVAAIGTQRWAELRNAIWSYRIQAWKP